MRSYFKDHWTGQHGFGLTVFVNLLCISFIATSLTIEEWSFWAANLGVGVLCILLIWQIVGALRCARNLQKDRSDVWGIYLALIMATGLVSFQILDVVANRYFIEPRFKTIFGDDDFSTKLKGDTVYLGGEVNYLMYHALLIILSEHDNVKTISLESQGGIVFAGRTIGKLIEEKALETQVENYCYSVCTLVFAAGKRRVLKGGAEIGFHGYRYDIPYRYQTVDPIEEQEKDQVYLIGRGINAAFLKRAFGTDAKTLWKPTRAELYKAGFTTQP
jgi:hypothetical protein